MKVANAGGYDEGYSRCPCFWGKEPSTLVIRLLNKLPNELDLNVLDAGCGEGKNSIAFASRGAKVIGIDCSSLAISNAKKAWPKAEVRWVEADVRTYSRLIALSQVRPHLVSSAR